MKQEAGTNKHHQNIKTKQQIRMKMPTCNRLNMVTHPNKPKGAKILGKIKTTTNFLDRSKVIQGKWNLPGPF